VFTGKQVIGLPDVMDKVLHICSGQAVQECFKEGSRFVCQEQDDVLDETNDQKKNEAKKRNEVAMANQTMASTNEACMGLIYKSMTNEWPSGLASLYSY